MAYGFRIVDTKHTITDADFGTTMVGTAEFTGAGNFEFTFPLESSPDFLYSTFFTITAASTADAFPGGPLWFSTSVINAVSYLVTVSAGEGLEFAFVDVITHTISGDTAKVLDITGDVLTVSSEDIPTTWSGGDAITGGTASGDGAATLVGAPVANAIGGLGVSVVAAAGGTCLDPSGNIDLSEVTEAPCLALGAGYTFNTINPFFAVFEGTIDHLQIGKDQIDACYVGDTADGFVASNTVTMYFYSLGEI
jgi:hypothetical protein